MYYIFEISAQKLLKSLITIHGAILLLACVTRSVCKGVAITYAVWNIVFCIRKLALSESAIVIFVSVVDPWK